jgi:hypothetical protein
VIGHASSRLAAIPALDGLIKALARIGLPAWFLAVDLIWVARLDLIGIDADHYQRAAHAWLAGGDPWAVTAGGGITFAAGPHTLLFYAPTSLLPLAVSVAFWVLLGLAASVWLVRRLEVPVWWLAFPPLAHAIWNGNPQTLALALLVMGGSAAASVAVLIKLYAAVPLIVRPRSLVIAGIVLLVTLPILPWQLYLHDGLGISGHLATAWNGSAWRIPVLVPPTLLGLWILRRKGAEWLAVPAAWPATQFYYVSMALPVAVRRPWLAAVLALPLPLLTPIAVMAMAAMTVWRDRHPEVTPAEPAEPVPGSQAGRASG